MAISIDIQRIRSAEAHSIKDDYTEFDTVKVFTDTVGFACLYFPHGTGQAVADAINTALEIKP